MTSARQWWTNLLIAAFGVGVFALVAAASGRVDVRGGLGWDGSAYAQMVTGSLSDGTPNTALRPLVVLAARVPHALGFDVITSFQVINYLSAFVLYLIVCLLLEREGVAAQVRAVVVGNLALCIATAKMFAFYPVLIDLGAMAAIAAAFWCAGTERRWLAAVAAVLAVASREFGIAAAVYGTHRAIRLRRPWRETMATYLPAFVVGAVIRLTATGGGGDALSVGDAIANLSLWASPAFVAFFVYFSITMLGGVSALLVVRWRRCVTTVREQPELATFGAVVLAATVVGSLDVWRYLVFVLPVAVVLAGRELRGTVAQGVLAVMTLATLVTQRPFEQMTTAGYFRDWFPLYEAFGRAAASGTFAEVWQGRFVSLLFVLTACWLIRPAQHVVVARSPEA